VKFLVNGREKAVTASAEGMLLYVLRDDLDLTGTNYGYRKGSAADARLLWTARLCGCA
jgi:aerobic-type carbon monoxide dehydrogenase small subunit (CoxS/CutS family)